MKMFRDKGDDGKSFIHGIRHNGSLWQLLYDFLQAYKDRTEALKATPPTGETSTAQKLDAIIASQEQFGIRLGLLETRAENIHGLVFDLVTSLTTDPEKAKELSERIRRQVEALKSAKPHSD